MNFHYCFVCLLCIRPEDAEAPLKNAIKLIKMKREELEKITSDDESEEIDLEQYKTEMDAFINQLESMLSDLMVHLEKRKKS